MKTDGFLTPLDLAWSRDSAEKSYLQHKMIESADEICDERRSPLEDRHAGNYRTTEICRVCVAMDASKSVSWKARRQSTLEHR